MLWLLTLPFKIVVGLVLGLVLLPVAIVFVPIAFLLWVPFAILRTVLRLVVAVLVLPLVAVALLVAFALALVPLLPIVLLLGVIWMVVRAASRPGPIVVSYPR